MAWALREAGGAARWACGRWTARWARLFGLARGVLLLLARRWCEPDAAEGGVWWQESLAAAG
jgi:hypothetical protein